VVLPTSPRPALLPVVVVAVAAASTADASARSVCACRTSASTAGRPAFMARSTRAASPLARAAEGTAPTKQSIAASAMSLGFDRGSFRTGSRRLQGAVRVDVGVIDAFLAARDLLAQRWTTGEIQARIARALREPSPERWAARAYRAFRSVATGIVRSRWSPQTRMVHRPAHRDHARALGSPHGGPIRTKDILTYRLKWDWVSSP
jgi:hypothetical protein